MRERFSLLSRQLTPTIHLPPISIPCTTNACLFPNGNIGHGNTGSGNIGNFNNGTGNVGNSNNGNSNKGNSNNGNGNIGNGNIGNGHVGNFCGNGKGNAYGCILHNPHFTG